MELSDLTPRQYYEQVKTNPARARFGFGRKAAIINVALQCAYTRIDDFKTAYETDPKQLEYIKRTSDRATHNMLPDD